MSQTIYLSADMEANGKIPGRSSMLSFALVAFIMTPEGAKILSTFERNLNLLPNSRTDPSTDAFWAQNQEAYNATRINTVDPEVAMKEATEWFQSFDSTPVLVAMPATYDFLWLYWYFIYFTDDCPFGFDGVDVKTMVWTLIGGSFKETTKRSLPKSWKSKRRHTHVAIDDAMGQMDNFAGAMKFRDKVHALIREHQLDA